MESCPLASVTERIIDEKLDYFMPDYPFDDVRPGMKIALNCTQEEIDGASALEMSNVADALISQRQEGINVDMSGFTEETWSQATAICNTKIYKRMPDPVRSIYISRLLRKPLEIFAFKVDEALNPKQSKSKHE